MQRKDDVIRLFPEHLRFRWKNVAQQGKKLQEIRLRALRPVILYLQGEEWYLEDSGQLVTDESRARILPKEELEQIIRHICRYSLYAYEEEMGRGFVSADGGFRVGIAGEVILNPNRTVRSVRYISSLNIRVAHEAKGIALPLLPFLYEDARLKNTLLLSPPGCGKTTMLRDLIRLVSNGNELAPGQTVGVVDERSEIAGCFQGIPGNDVGKRTDVLDGCPKEEGMMMLLRSMAPKVMAVDELGGTLDAAALRQALKCGCAVLATVHGSSFLEVREKGFMKPLWEERAFERFVVLGKKEGRFMVEQIYDREGNILAEGI